MAAPDEIGKGSHPAQNPPPLRAGDVFVWEWYQENCSALIRDFELMPFLLKELGLDESGMRVMVLKLGRIHDAMKRMGAKEAQRMQAEMN